MANNGIEWEKKLKNFFKATFGHKLSELEYEFNGVNAAQWKQFECRIGKNASSINQIQLPNRNWTNYSYIDVESICM